MELTHRDLKRAKFGGSSGQNNCSVTKECDYLIEAVNQLSKATDAWKQAEDSDIKRAAVLAQRAAQVEVFTAMRDSDVAALEERIFQAKSKLKNHKTRNQKNAAQEELVQAIQAFNELLEEWDSKDPKKEAAELYPMPPIGVGKLL